MNNDFVRCVYMLYSLWLELPSLGLGRLLFTANSSAPKKALEMAVGGVEEVVTAQLRKSIAMGFSKFNN